MRVLLLLYMLVIAEAKRKQPKGSGKPRERAFSPGTQSDSPYNIYSYPIPVDFIHMGKEGILDPSSGIKQPFDGLSFSFRYPTSPEEESKMLQNASPNNINKISKVKPYKSPPISPPVSIREYNPVLEEEETDMTHAKVVNNNPPMMFDFETIQNLNVASPYIYRSNIAKSDAIFKRRLPPSYNETVDRDMVTPPNASNFFIDNLFELGQEANSGKENWTTCDEFGKNARFHPREVAGVDWVAFYVWTPSSFPRSYDYSFSYPSYKTVEEYRNNYSRHVNETIDWKQPMLLLKSWTEILLVAVGRRGLFYGIPKLDLPEQIKNTSYLIPYFTMRMKVVDPYLGIMMCEDRIGIICAVAGEEPEVKDREAEAARLGFNGIGEILYNDEESGEHKREKTRINYAEDRESEDMAVPKRMSPFFRDDPMFP